MFTIDRNRAAVEMLGWKISLTGFPIKFGRGIKKYYYLDPQGRGKAYLPDLHDIDEAMQHIVPVLNKYHLFINIVEQEKGIFCTNLSYNLDEMLDKTRSWETVESEFRYGEGATEGGSLIDAFLRFMRHIKGGD